MSIIVSAAIARVVLLLFLLSPVVSAQDAEPTNGASKGDPDRRREYAITGGRFLPYRVAGVREIMDMVALRVGFAVPDFFRLDTMFQAANEFGNSFYTISGDISAIHSLSPDSGFFYEFGVGGDLHYYKPITLSGKAQGWIFTQGWHITVSPVIRLADPFFLRVELKYGFGPRQNLYVGVGLAYFGESVKDSAQP